MVKYTLTHFITLSTKSVAISNTIQSSIWSNIDYFGDSSFRIYVIHAYLKIIIKVVMLQRSQTIQNYLPFLPLYLKFLSRVVNRIMNEL